jgi:hypothetical protein
MHQGTCMISSSTVLMLQQTLEATGGDYRFVAG